jgi:hypothetical protein
MPAQQEGPNVQTIRRADVQNMRQACIFDANTRASARRVVVINYGTKIVEPVVARASSAR